MSPRLSILVLGLAFMNSSSAMAFQNPVSKWWNNGYHYNGFYARGGCNPMTGCSFYSNPKRIDEILNTDAVLPAVKQAAANYAATLFEGRILILKDELQMLGDQGSLNPRAQISNDRSSCIVKTTEASKGKYLTRGAPLKVKGTKFVIYRNGTEAHGYSGDYNNLIKEIEIEIADSPIRSLNCRMWGWEKPQDHNILQAINLALENPLELIVPKVDLNRGRVYFK